jgi:hypothetical protein
MLRLTGLRQEQAVGHPFPYPWLIQAGHANGNSSLDQAPQFEAISGIEGVVTDAEGNRNLVFSISPVLGSDGRPSTCSPSAVTSRTMRKPRRLTRPRRGTR